MRAGWILREMQYEGLHKHIWNLSEGRIFKFWRILCTKGFKRNNDFIDDYVTTKDLTYKDKLRDIELMIEAFVEEERYEDCALLVKIKEKVVKYEKSLTSGKL